MLGKELYHQLFKHSLSKNTNVTYWDGKTRHYGSKDGDPVFEIKINEKIPVSAITNSPSLALGEAYMDKNIEIDGSIEDLIYDIYCQSTSFLNDSKLQKLMPKDSHSKQRSSEDIHSHYDLGNDFYRMWLDPTMTYSCAYFNTPEDTLEEAQMNKVRHTLDKLFIKEDDTLLDIGCGWGTLIMTAAKEYGAKATGITLSEEQFAHVIAEIEKEGLQDKISVELLDYRDLGKRQFNHITSIGMFEHVGSENLPEYFEVVRKSLTPDGTALIHGITGPHNRGDGRDAWINKYIFPGGYIPHLTEIVTDITNANLQLIDLESLRRHYQKTLEIWTENFYKVLPKVEAKRGERFARMWDLYLQACAASFESSNIDVIQYLLVKSNNNTLPLHRKN